MKALQSLILFLIAEGAIKPLDGYEGGKLAGHSFNIQDGQNTLLDFTKKGVKMGGLSFDCDNDALTSCIIIGAEVHLKPHYEKWEAQQGEFYPHVAGYNLEAEITRLLEKTDELESIINQ